MLVDNDETKKRVASAREEIRVMQLAAQASAARLEGQIDDARQEAMRRQDEESGSRPRSPTKNNMNS